MLRGETLARELRAQALRRGLVPATGLDEDPVLALCRLVRAIPYGPPSVRTPDEVLEAWQGTSAGKHALLLAVLGEAGVPARAFLRTHRVTRARAARFGPEVVARVPEGGLVDVHAWLGVAWRGRLRAVDVTFPSPIPGAEADQAPGAGPAPPRSEAGAAWDGTLPMPLACGPGEDVPLGPRQRLVGAADALAALRGDRMAREELLAAIARAVAAP